MLTGKQRSYLKSIANGIEPIFQIGKNGINENFIKQVDEALEAREIIKINVLKNSFLDTKTAANEVA
ncbi:YhbY family RNA-binding protein, partial [Anaerosalibacter bizertensis]|nr:YhbY family RNA-binding protein [Anaerosalibacter bizertensis]